MAYRNQFFGIMVLLIMAWGSEALAATPLNSTAKKKAVPAEKEVKIVRAAKIDENPDRNAMGVQASTPEPPKIFLPPAPIPKPPAIPRAPQTLSLPPAPPKPPQLQKQALPNTTNLAAPVKKAAPTDS